MFEIPHVLCGCVGGQDGMTSLGLCTGSKVLLLLDAMKDVEYQIVHFWFYLPPPERCFLNMNINFCMDLKTKLGLIDTDLLGRAEQPST
jgi:hypothetical protein